MQLIALCIALSLASAWASPDWTTGVETGSGPSTSTAIAIRSGSAGQIYVAGTLTSTSDDFVLLRYDRMGQERWRVVYDGPSGGADLLRALAVDPAGNAYAVGRSTGSNGVAELAVLKCTANGVQKWLARHRDPANTPLDASAAAVDPSGNVYVVGLRPSQNLLFDQLLLRFSNRGQLQWTRTNASGLNAATARAAVATDGAKAVYVVGMSDLPSDSHVSLSRYLQKGDLEWRLFHPGSLPTNSAATAAAVDSAGNLYLVSSDRVKADSPADGRIDVQTEKVSRRGAVLWRSRHRGAEAALLEPAALTLDSTGNAIVVGQEKRSASPGRSDLFAVSYDRLGRERWSTCQTVPGNEVSGMAMTARRQGGVALAITPKAGLELSDLVAIGWDNTGSRRWRETSDLRIQPRGIAAPSPDAIIVTGDVIGTNGLPRLVTLGYTVPKEKAPLLVRPPRARAVLEGTATTFGVEARGTGLLTYQWMRCDQPISEAINRTHTIPSADAEDIGDYAVEVRDEHGAVLSPAARLTLLRGPRFVSAPASRSVPVGSLAWFSAGIDGTEPIHLQWQQNGYSIPGAHDPFLVLPAVTPAERGTYRLIASNVVGVAVSAPAGLEVVKSGALDTWSWIEPYPQGNPLWAVAFGNGRFVAVNEGGTLVSSTDGVNWDVSSAAAHEELRDVTWADGRFIAVGGTADGQGLFRLSEDGVEWRAQSVASSNWLFRVAAGGGMILAESWDGSLFRSTNGTDWSRHNPGINPSALGYGNGLFIAAANVPLVYSSPDGISWTAHDLPQAIAPSDVVYGGGRFVLVGHDQASLAVSSTGRDWTLVSYQGSSALTGITYGGGEFVAVAQGGNSYASIDGLTWYEQSIGPRSIHDVAYGNGLFVCVGALGGIFTSPNPGFWTPRSIGGGDKKYRAVHSVEGMTVVVGDEGTVLSSVGGSSFTPCAVSTFEHLRAVTHGARLWVAVGKNGSIQTSPDAAVWSEGGSPVGEDLYGAAFGNGRFVVVGDRGRILTSTDGMDWRQRSSGTTNLLRAVFYGGQTFAAVGEHGTLLTSADAERWTRQDAQTHQELMSVCFGNGVWVAAGDDGDLSLSVNGGKWVGSDSGFDKLEGLAYDGGHFVMLARGAVLSSPDGEHWDQHFPGVTAGLRDLAFENGRVIGVGDDQTIVISDPVPPR